MVRSVGSDKPKQYNETRRRHKEKRRKEVNSIANYVPKKIVISVST
jgi:hypothetical protein